MMNFLKTLKDKLFAESSLAINTQENSTLLSCLEHIN